MSPDSSLSPQPLVSVVTPFHNTAEYLAECIESVIHQSYQNWEYTLLDNCSTDGSDRIARKYAASEPRIRLLRNDTLLPQAQNYNAALSQISAQSSYCKMVQADDWIYPECLERMVKIAESDSLIGIVSSYALWGDHILGDGLPYTTTVLPGPEICRQQLLTSLFLFGSPTTLLYRSEIVRGTSPFFDPSTLHDDTDVCYRILQTWKLGFAHQILSFSRIDKSSLMSRARQLGTGPIDKFLQLSKFGPVFLEPNELAVCLETCKSDYYRFLARRLLSGSSIAFWRYHRSGLESGGQRIEYASLFKHFCQELLWLLVNPGFTVSLLHDRIRLNKMSNEHPSCPRGPQPQTGPPHDIPATRDLW